MKYRLFLYISLLSFQNLIAQNIPRANYTAPWGVQVNTFNGNLYLNRTDLVLPNQGLSIDLSFGYNSFRDTLDIGFGKGWTFSYGMRYEIIGTTDTMVLEHADGRRDTYINNGAGYIAPPGIFDTWSEYESGKFRLTTKYGMKYDFGNATHKRLTGIEDANGNRLILTYNGQELTSIADHSGRVVTLGWSEGHLSTITDPNFSPARTVEFTYQDSLLTTVKDPENQMFVYGYNSEGSLNHLVNEKGDEMRVTYNELGRVSEMATCIAYVTFTYNPDQGKTYITEKNSGGDRVTIYTYDEAGKLLQKTGNCCGYNTQYAYDEDNNVSNMTDANGNVFTANHDALGNALATTDAEGAGQSFSFEQNLNRLASITDKRGNATSMQYDGNGNLLKIVQPQGVEVSFSYDAKGNIASVTDGNGNTTNLTYNTNNDVTGIQYPIGQETFEFDAVGNLKVSRDGNGNAVHYQYDALNRLRSIADDLNNEVLYDYDGASNLTQETDPNGAVKTYAYDAHNRLEGVTTPSGTTGYGYDASDNLTAITDANQHTSVFEYDQRDLLVSERDPLNHSTAYTYDGNGNLVSRTDANGMETTYTYDRLNRLLSKTYNGNTDNYAYDANGNLVQCSNNHISMSFSYDALNRLTSKTINNWGITIAYEYDLAGNRTKMTDPAGETLYGYDANNRLISITNPAAETTTFTYDAGGRLTRQDYANGAYAVYGYDVANRLTALINLSASGTVLAGYGYTYDANGNRLSMTTPQGTTSYTYDGDNRLLSASYTGIVAPDESYAYDGAGNRTNFNGTAYTYDAADRLQSAGNITYNFDANGNLTLKNENGQVTQYAYDGENRLTSLTLPSGEQVNFQYDPFGNRIGQSGQSGATRYLLDGDNVLMELDAAGNTLARYTAGLSLDSWISMERGGQSYFYHTDGLGSITALTNGAQSIAASYQYDAYGNILAQTGSVVNPYTYTGREYDAATGLYYYRTRFYDAKVGRFLTRDGFRGIQDRPLSLNKYLYVEGNPVLYTDPNGEFLPLIVGVAARYLTMYYTKKVGLHLLKGGAVGLIKEFIKNKGNINCIDWWNVGIDAIFGASWLGPYKNIYKIPVKDQARRKAMDSVQRNIKRLGKSGRVKSQKDFEEIVDAIYKGDLRYFFEKVSIDFAKFLGKKQAKNEVDWKINCENSTGNQEGVIDYLIPGIGEITIPIIRAIDPNEIIAPEGCGVQKWVARQATLPYTILFENDPDFATAPAQTVRIEHVFDSELNPFAFRLGDFGFGNYYFTVPNNVSYYNTRIDLSDSLGVLLDVTAGLDISNNKAFWILESKDPLTGLAATLPANTGFLPVNDTLSHAGEGFVNFTIGVQNSAVTGDTIHAVADIIFDDNAAIRTNTAFNIIDADAPESLILSIDTLSGNRFHLTWSGSDAGSGITGYKLYAATNTGPFLPIADDLTDTEYTFNGQTDSTYQFFTVATDCVGNIEPLKNSQCALILSDTTLVHPTNGQANGSITVEIAGATGNLNYTWSPNVASGPSAGGIGPGIYTITASDGQGCSLSIELVLENITGTVAPGVQKRGLFIHKLYPVPAQATVTVEFTSPSRLVWMEVFAPNGQKVIGKTLNASTNELNRETLDVANWPAGSYQVNIRSKEGGVSGVFVKQ